MSSLEDSGGGNIQSIHISTGCKLNYTMQASYEDSFSRILSHPVELQRCHSVFTHDVTFFIVAVDIVAGVSALLARCGDESVVATQRKPVV
jgi:hypothetical protein